MRIVTIILAILAVLVVAVLAVPFLVPRDWLVAKVSDAIKDATGRPFAIEGDVSLALIPTPRLVAEQIRLGEGDTPLLQVGKLEAVVAAMPLLQGRVDVQRFIVAAPVIHLRVDENGIGNWQTEAGTPQAGGSGDSSGDGGGGLPDLALGEVRVEDGVVDYADARSGLAERVEDIDIDLRAPDLRGPSSVAGTASFRGEKVSVDLTVQDTRTLIEQQQSQGSLKLTGPVAAAFTGMLSAAPSGTVQVDLPEVARAVRWLDLPVPPTAPMPEQVALAGRLAVADQVVTFDDIRLTSDLLQATGALRFDGAAARPKLGGEFATDVIDVARLMPPPAPASTGEPPAPAAPASGDGPAPDPLDQPLNLPTSLPLDLDVAVAAKGIKAPQATLGPTRVRVTSGPNFVLLNLVEAQAYSGKITGRVNTAADAQGVPRVAIKLAAAGLQVAPLLRDLAQQERLDGRMALNADLAGDARTARSLMGGLDGKADVTLLNGVVHGFDLSRLSGDPVQVAARLAQGGLSGGSTPFGRAGASFTIANGIARTDDLAAETPLANISGTARLNLGAQRIEEMRLIPKPVPGRGGVLGQIPEVPILVSGPFSGPSVSVDADAALEALAKDPKTVNRVLDQVNKLGGKDSKPLIPEEAGNLLKGLLGKRQ